MKKLILFFFMTVVASVSHAVDASNYVTNVQKIGDWELIEFALPKQIIYRLSSTAINDGNLSLNFDFKPEKNCNAGPALLIVSNAKYSKSLENGYVPISFKFTGNKNTTNDLARTSIEHGDSNLYMQLNKLTTDSLFNSSNKGKLALWISSGAEIKGSQNIYFSVDGLKVAYEKGKASCSSNTPN
jgi:hypothetical protein